jgi:hypothetical protein
VLFPDRGVSVAVPSRRRSPLRTAAVIVTTLSTSGCSFILSRRPPPYYAVTPSFECTRTYAPAIADTVLAATYAALTAGNIWAGASGRGAWFVGSKGFSVVLGANAAAYGGSAVWGYGTANECREALRHSVGLPPGWRE